MKKFNIEKKIIVSIVSLFTCITLSGCGEVIKSFVATDLNAAITTRINQNIECADLLKSGGFISDATYTNIIESLKSQLNTYTVNEDDVISLSSDSPLVAAVSGLKAVNGWAIHKDSGSTIIHGNNGENITVYEDGDTTENGTPEKLCQYSISNYLLYGESGNGGIKGVGLAASNATADDNCDIFYFEDSCTKITLIGDEAIEEINNKFTFPVYVLKANIQTQDNSGSIDEVVAAINSAITKSSNGYSVNVSVLDKYFEQAYDFKGEPVKLLDNNTDAQIVKTSEAWNMSPENAAQNRPGYDMLVSQWGVPCMAIRYQEFDMDNIKKLNQVIGLGNECRYIFTTEGAQGANRAYLMEYPVSVLQEMTDLDKDGNTKNEVKWETSNNSGLAINLYTGKIMKYDKKPSGGFTTAAQAITENSDMYLTVGGTDSNSKMGQSSFIIKGTTETQIPTGLDGSKKVKVSCGRIILRDYLEATYAPRYDNGNSGEKVHVFGRKIRIMFQNWEESDYGTTSTGTKIKQYTPIFTKGTTVAYFIDADGNELVGGAKLEITDFCSAISLRSASDPRVIRFNRIGESEEIIAGGSEKDDVADLKVNTQTNAINPITMFPSLTMGKADYNSDSIEKQRFYTITTTKGLFDSGLFSSWIESTSSTASLDWWNKYLQDNKFIYNVDHVNINNFLTGNYQYQLSQNGVVILDLETVSKIQDMYEKEDSKDRINFIRTIFVLVGWSMIGLSFLLMLLWVMDTNADLGFALLTKVTFGHWVAVKYADDIPSNNNEEVKYLTFSNICIKVAIFIAIGIILIRINVFEIVAVLIRIFGSIASEAGDMIKGLR